MGGDPAPRPNQDVDQRVRKDALGAREIARHALPVVEVSSLDVRSETVEEIVLFEPDSNLVTRIGDDVGKEDTGEPLCALGRTDRLTTVASVNSVSSMNGGAGRAQARLRVVPMRVSARSM